MRRRLLALFAVLCLAAALTGGQVAAAPPDVAEGAAIAGGFSPIRPIDQVVCQDVYTGGFAASHYAAGDCIRVDFTLQGAGEDPEVTMEFIGPDGATITSVPAFGGDTGWRAIVKTDDTWPAGDIIARVVVAGQAKPAGEGGFALNTLVADIVPEGKAGGEPYAPGEAINVTGTVYQLTSAANGANTKTGVPADLQLRVVGPDGDVAGPFPDGGTITAAANGDFAFTIPAGETDVFEAGAADGYQTTVSIEGVNATYTDPDSGQWRADRAGAAGLLLFTQPDSLVLDNSFVSSLGWVKPGETYPSRVTVSNYTANDATNVVVRVWAPDGATMTGAVPLKSTEQASVEAGGEFVLWDIGTLPKAVAGKPTTSTLVVEARARRLSEDPKIVWKDISSTANLTYAEFGGADPISSESHGPKVIPVAAEFDTARYGDKPFPMVPVDYRDLKHEDRHTGAALSSVVNDPEVDGSTFNLYQEMSYGQLYPEGTVPSAGTATAGFDGYDPGFQFTTPQVPGDCRGVTMGLAPSEVYGTPVYPERIVNGWYQLPGDTEYYGGDFPAFTLGEAGGNDSACGQNGKAVYDGAQIADPEIDYNDYDSDKDGVVDFFMLVFVGCGGNGASQLAPAGSCPNTTVPYDNIWPHSSSLEMQYKDEATGLRGYISDDQLKSLEEVPQCWTAADRVVFDDCEADGGTGKDDLPVFVRVGPYNVNPETAIDHASVISHEYGHHLGLPDFYNSGQEVYADLNLMAADHAQHMTVFAKQDLGWVVPEFIGPGDQIDVQDWAEIKDDTGAITWETPAGDEYTLSAGQNNQNIHNGEVYGAKLPPRQLIDPLKVKEQTAQPGTNVWYSGRGNDFGCNPNGGHNLDIALPELAEVAPGTPVTVEFKSSWDIEWDWDYGFVLTTIDGVNYVSHPSENGYTTLNAYNPNSQTCFTEHNNGLTGQSGAYQKGEPAPTQARNPTGQTYNDGAPFLDDAYDISDLAGQRDATLRFSYFTDAAFDRPGWFIDDVVVKAGDEVIYESNFESGEESGRLFPGGCDPDGIQTAAKCTNGWTAINADEEARLDHAYYLELRDQVLFDFDGYGQDERGNTSWDPGVFIEYTDEAHGYGNSGVEWPPAQHYLDSQPQPGLDCVAETDGNCADASFTDAAGDRHFDDTVDADQPKGWIDNFNDALNEEKNEEYGDELWHFDYNCLDMTVDAMSGETVGPAPGAAKLPADLAADATLEGGPGCREMAYVGADDNVAPVAVAQAKPRRGRVNTPFTFDAGRSYDDFTALDRLSFAWDLDGDGFDDGNRQSVVRRYRRAGTYNARVRVTDAQGLSSIDAVTVVVTAADEPDPDPDPDPDPNPDPDPDPDGGVGDEDDDRRDDDADRGGDRTPTGGVGDIGAERDVGAVANTGSSALTLLAGALLALTAGAWLLLRSRRFQP